MVYAVRVCLYGWMVDAGALARVCKCGSGESLSRCRRVGGSMRAQSYGRSWEALAQRQRHWLPSLSGQEKMSILSDAPVICSQ